MCGHVDGRLGFSISALERGPVFVVLKEVA
jgi:hypothetical protein